jgi:hypothetical protein
MKTQTRQIVSKFLLLVSICSFGCEKPAQIGPKIVLKEPKSFSLIMDRNNARGPCNQYKIIIDPNGKSIIERSCQITLDLSKCKTYESNGISNEIRACRNPETEKRERQISPEKIRELIAEIKESDFFSFEDDYSQMSKNCYPSATDTPSVDLTIKFDETEKTIRHYHGCFVKSLNSEQNALQPLRDLEDKIDEIAGTETWKTGEK